MELKIINKEFTIDPLNENAEKIFREGTAKFDKYWLSAGTALGLWRDGDFIQGDTDIDIAMEGYDGIGEEIKEKMKDFELIREIYDPRPMQLAFKKDGVIFDIYIHWRNGENFENHGESGWTRMNAEILNPIYKETKYGTFPFPQEEYYQIRYGDWKTPRNEKPIFQEV